MNKQLYRLVFSKHLGMYIPASEAVRSHTCKSGGSRLRSRRRALAALLAAFTLQSLPAFAAQPAGLIPHGSLAWSNAAIDAARTSASQMTIRQTAAKAILNWQQLNLNRGETLNFDQGGNTTWSALNRIYDANPSIISGNVNASGNIYFVNQNGIIFGNGAQINVGSLTASSLDITDSLFNAGILSDYTKPVFMGTGGFVRVAQGAALTAATGGRVMLLGENVTNEGVIVTPDGQTILAAGHSVYLAAGVPGAGSQQVDPAGLIVEVSSGGTAKNLGDIIAQRGNVTLVGLAVNQSGRINASTSVRANGSIILKAQYWTDDASASAAISKEQSTGQITDIPDKKGTVTLAQGSTTTVDVDVSDTEVTIPLQGFVKSRVEVSGNSVNIDGAIVAHGGEVLVTASSDGFGYGFDADTHIKLGATGSIDVSGIVATAPMSRNQIQLQLYSEQFKNAPLQRGGPLLGKTVYIDARKGTALTDIAPSLALFGTTVAEKSTSAGTVTFSTPGDVVTAASSNINLSGGQINYAAGLVKESYLIRNGKMVAISQADPNLLYQGVSDVYSVTDAKWGVTRSWNINSGGNGTYYNAYIAGSAAGSLTIKNDATIAHSVVLDGQLLAHTVIGDTQRQGTPTGGTVNVDVLGIAHLTALNAALAAGESRINTAMFDHGINALTLTAHNVDSLTPTAITVDSAIHTDPKGKVALTADNININADIVSPGGSITATGANVATTLIPDAKGVAIADGVTVSTAGLWTNDAVGGVAALKAPIVLDGGSLTLGGTVTVGQASLLDASAGAWLQANNKLKGGKGGNVKLSGGSNLVELLSHIKSYGFSQGGQLSLAVELEGLQVGGQAPVTGTTNWLPVSAFEQNGFSSYSINAVSMVIGDASGAATLLHPKMQTLQLDNGAITHASGTAIADVTTPTLLAEGARSPTSISLTTMDGNNFSGALSVLPNTVIATDAPVYGSAGRGNITLKSDDLTVYGNLVSPAGNIVLGGGSRVLVGNNASIQARGYDAIGPSGSNGQLNADVLAGGTISASLYDGALSLAASSVLDVSGISGQADISSAKGGFARETLYGAAGTININANSMALDGDLLGVATGTGKAGSLVIDSSGGNYITQSNTVFTLTQNRQSRAGLLSYNLAVPGSAIGQNGAISAEQISQGGFDHFVLTNKKLADPANANRALADKTVLESGLQLTLPGSITLESPQFTVTGNGTAQLAAPLVTIVGTPNILGVDVPTAILGNAALKVNADWINLVGAPYISGVKTTELNSRLDIQARGYDAIQNSGGLTAPGTIKLSARQIYPVTSTAFRFDAIGANSLIDVSSSGVASTPVWSAGGMLSLNADDIVQGGVLRAPLGTLNLNATNNLTLTAGSLTSVSAEGLTIPYGITNATNQWVAPGTQLITDSNTGITTGYAVAPSPKSLTLNAKNVVVQASAKVDVSGGGNVEAMRWVDGIGGSNDILNQAGVYAIMPGMAGSYAPYDSNFNANFNLSAGTTAVYLAGAPGLAAGIYTLLPASYATLPGAFLVQTSSKSLVPGQSLKQENGTTLISGYGTALGTDGRDTKWSTFQLTDGSVFRPAKNTISHAPAEYVFTSGNQYFRDLAVQNNVAIPRLTADAGQLLINAGQKLTMNGQLLASKPDGALGALVDIVNSKISVVSTSDVPADGTLQLTADTLNNLKAGSLLLGGTRTFNSSTGNTDINTSATDIVFANDATHSLAVSELIATATNSVTVKTGAVLDTIASTGTIGSSKLRTSGNGALLAVSGSNDLLYSRDASAVTGTSGTLDIQAGAGIHAHRSLAMDATQTLNLNGGLTVEKGGSVTIGATEVALLGKDVAAQPGLNLTANTLAGLADVASMTLNSTKNIGIYGNLTFGNQNLDLVFNAGGIGSHLAAGETAIINAKTFTLQNNAGATFSSTGLSNTGTLNVNANTIALAGASPNDTLTPATGPQTSIGGFSNTNLTATGELQLNGVGQTALGQAGSTTTLSSGRITAASAANYQLTSAGTLTTVKVATPDVLTQATGLGARIGLQAATLNLGGDVDFPSGQFTAEATTGNLNVASGASIKAAAIPVNFSGYATEYTPGGSIKLIATLGNVNVASVATLDVSGAGTADAGNVIITASKGNIDIAPDAIIKGQVATGRESGKFTLDANTITSFSNLNTALNNGQFNALRDIRLRMGNLSVASSDTVTANHVILAADTGNIVVAGTISADGINGGQIELYAKNDVNLQNSAKLYARGTGDTLILRDNSIGAGGTVILSSVAGNISATTGALIDVSGDQNPNGSITDGVNVNTPVLGAAGKVILRAARTGGGSGTGITSIATNVTGAIKGAGEVRLESMKTYSTTTLNTSLQNTITTNTTSFIAAATPGLAGYQLTQDGLSATLVAGVEVNSAGDLTVANDWNLNAGALKSTDGTLTLKAAGNLFVNGSLSDGFSSALAAGTVGTTTTPGNDKTWAFNLISGADVTAANPFSTIKSAAGTSDTVGALTLAGDATSGKLIRTGSEGIRIATGGDLILGSALSTIYTVGRVLQGYGAPLTSADGVNGFSWNVANYQGAIGNKALYMTGGGNIDIRAQGSIIGSELTGRQNVNQWLWRAGGATQTSVKYSFQDTSWWVRPDLFAQGVAALGGGNVSVQADGDIKQFSVSIPTTGRYDTYNGVAQITGNLANGTANLGSSTPGTGAFSVDGGGSMRVEAGGNIYNGTYYTGRGNTRLIAGGVIAADPSLAGTTANAGTLLALQDSSADVTATHGVLIDGVFNPTLYSQVADYGSRRTPTTFNTMSSAASLTLTSVLGDVTTAANAPDVITPTYGTAQTYDVLGRDNMGLLPGNVSITTFTGDVAGNKQLMPSAQGNLRLLVAGSLSGNISMSDADLSSFLGVYHPSGTGVGSNSVLDLLGHSAQPLHLNDSQPILMVANNGSVNLTLDLPKEALIHAGQDAVINGNIQQLSANDLTVIEAGRDYLSSVGGSLKLAGPGNLLVKADRNVLLNSGAGATLGDSGGIQTVANTLNKNLSPEGASITVLAGLGKAGAKVTDYIASYIDPTGSGPKILQTDAAALASYRLKTAVAVGDYMRSLTGNTSLSDDAAMTQYLTLDANRQLVFVARHFSAELAASATDFAKTRSNDRGDNAIAMLFPAGSGYKGDISVLGTAIKTLRNGSIDLLAPGGYITAGLPGGASGEIVTEHGGAIRAFAETDFQVNAGKVITQYGSDVTVWVNNGDIDAGRGSKTAVSVPAQQFSMDLDGNATTEFLGVAQGSGIRAQTYDADGPNGPMVAPLKGTVILAAPRGILNASEAGIEAGNFIAVAPVVLGANNIEVAGKSSGVPVADTGGLAGSLGGTNVGDVTKSAMGDIGKQLSQSNDQLPSKNFMPSFISVEVIGLGS